MRRNSHLVVIAGFALSAILLAAGGLLLWGSTYVHNTVQGQLAVQQIYFPPQAAFAHPKAGSEITPSMIPSVSQYAGQQLLTGQQAEAYADQFIAVHITNMTGGQTYAQLSGQGAGQPEQHQAGRPGRHRVQGRGAAVHAAERVRLVEGLPDHLHRRAGRLRARRPDPDRLPVRPDPGPQGRDHPRGHPGRKPASHA